MCAVCGTKLSQAYRDIFGGRWEDWDPFMAGPRMRAAEASSSSSWAGDDSAATPGGLVGGVPGGGKRRSRFDRFKDTFLLAVGARLAM